MEILLVEQQVLVLGVDIHKPFAKFFQHRQLHGGVVDERTTFARCHQFAADDTVFRIVLDVVILEEIVHPIARKVEMGFDNALVGSILDGLGVSTLP